jgi:hypothetical protein
MPPSELRFPDLTTRDIRAAKKLTGQLVEAPDLDTLGREMIRGTEKIQPAVLRFPRAMGASSRG